MGGAVIASGVVLSSFGGNGSSGIGAHARPVLRAMFGLDRTEAGQEAFSYGLQRGPPIGEPELNTENSSTPSASLIALGRVT